MKKTMMVFALHIAVVALAEPVSVKDFGAVADGKTDATAAIQKAIDSLGARGGRVDIPAGEYLVGGIKLKPGVTLQGAAGYSFRRTNAGTTLKLNTNSTAKALIDITGAIGATVRDIAIVGDIEHIEDIEAVGFQVGPKKEKVVHGIGLFKPDFGKEEDTPLIDHCCIRSFSGDGIHLERIWCGNIRNCLIGPNGGDGIQIMGWDVFIIDNEIFSSGGYGIHGVIPNNAGTITANRIEWNHCGGLYLEEGRCYCINANYFDRSGTAAVIFENAGDIVFTGNQLYRSGKPEWARAEVPYSAHAIIRNSKGVTFSSNNLVLGRDDGGKGQYSPRIGIILEKLTDSVVIGNTGYEAVLEKYIDDRGGHSNTVIRDNPGSVRKGK